jgi:hypothetical protein
MVLGPVRAYPHHPRIPSSCPAASPSEEIPFEESTSMVHHYTVGINEPLTRLLPKLTRIMLSHFNHVRASAGAS